MRDYLRRNRLRQILDASFRGAKKYRQAHCQ